MPSKMKHPKNSIPTDTLVKCPFCNRKQGDFGKMLVHLSRCLKLVKRAYDEIVKEKSSWDAFLFDLGLDNHNNNIRITLWKVDW
jgi:hypothetical protein